MRTENVSERRDEGCFGIAGVNADATDVLGCLETDVAPAPARIGRFVDAVAVGDIQPDGGFPSAGIDRVGIRGCHRERTDGSASQKTVGDAAPIDPIVDGLPDAAGACPEIGHRLVRGIARDGDHASATRGSNAPPSQASKVRGSRNAYRCRHEGVRKGGRRERLCSRNRRGAPHLLQPVTGAGSDLPSFLASGDSFTELCDTSPLPAAKGISARQRAGVLLSARPTA